MKSIVASVEWKRKEIFEEYKIIGSHISHFLPLTPEGLNDKISHSSFLVTSNYLNLWAICKIKFNSTTLLIKITNLTTYIDINKLSICYNFMKW